MTDRPRLPPLWLLVGVTGLAPVSLHILIPSIPGLAKVFATDFATVQLTLTLYLAGLSIGQLIYGPLSDRLGRRPVMLAGLFLYLGATLACAVAWSAGALIVARVLQAASGCAGMVIGRAIIRDVHERDRAASLIGYVTMVMALGAAFAPAIGGVLDEAFGWRANFVLLAVIGGGLFACALLFLHETNLERRTDIGRRHLIYSYAVLLRSPAFLGYAFCSAFSMAGWYAFTAGAPYVMVHVLGLPQTHYGFYILIAMAGYVAGNFIAGRLSTRIGGDRMIVIGTAVGLFGAAIQVALALAGWLTPLALFLPMAVVVLAGGIFLPNANAGALSVHPRIAGAASSLTGFIQMAVSSAATVIVGYFTTDTEAPLIATIVGATLLSAIAFSLAAFRGVGAERRPADGAPPS